MFKRELGCRMGHFGYTALHEAASNGKAEILEYLLEQGGNDNINSKSCTGYTPLHVAASNGSRDCVKVLLDHGADVRCTDEFGKTARQTAQLCGRNTVVMKLLHGEGKQCTAIVQHYKIFLSSAFMHSHVRCNLSL